MRVNTKEFENILCGNLIENGCLQNPVLIESWEVSAYNLHRVLLNREKSPYFYPHYEGIFNISDLSFYEICFYSFMSGVEYAVMKNNTRFKNIDYWEMHKYVGGDMLFQAVNLHRGIKALDPSYLQLGGIQDMGRKGFMSYRIVSMVVNSYFSQKGILDFKVLDESGFEDESPISNISDVLATLHRVGIVCAFDYLAKEKNNEIDAKEFKLFGGPGMNKFSEYL